MASVHSCSVRDSVVTLESDPSLLPRGESPAGAHDATSLEIANDGVLRSPVDKKICSPRFRVVQDAFERISDVQEVNLVTLHNWTYSLWIRSRR